MNSTMKYIMLYNIYGTDKDLHRHLKQWALRTVEITCKKGSSCCRSSGSFWIFSSRERVFT